MSKTSQPPLPPLPQKRKPLPMDKPRTTRQDWEKYINTQIRNYMKFEHKSNNPGLIEAFDLTGEMLTRRKQVLLDSLPQVISRYPDFQSRDPNVIGDRWVNLNTSFFSYSFLESRTHILLAASIWILDHIEVGDVFPLLPKDDELLDDYYDLDVWDPQYSDELLASVQYVLANRNGEPEVTKSRLKKVLTDVPTAINQQHFDTPNRKSFDRIISMIPQKDIDHAVKVFEDLFWKWTDRFFAELFPLQKKLDSLLQTYEEKRILYNEVCDQIAESVDELDRYRKSRRESAKKKPVIAPAVPKMQVQLPSFEAPSLSRMSSALLSRDMELDKITAKLFSKFEELERLDSEADDVLDEVEEATDEVSKYVLSTMRGSDFEHPDRKPLPIKDAYELCFALLYMIDSGSDLPWIYGVGFGLMQEVTECLPWGIAGYNEEDDAFSNEFKYKGKKSNIPDWNERKYRGKDDYFARSMSQLLYEETGCILPRNMHLYDRRTKALSKYGVKDDEMAYLLSTMTALAHARRQRIAQNLDEEFDDEGAQETIGETGEDNTAAYREEIKRLRTALHDAEKAARDARKSLEDNKAQALLEHRELADLRELVFRQNEEELAGEDEPAKDTGMFPYTVQRDTLVFGGHDSWTKAIKKLLTGNIRFVSKDYVFDTSIIRHVDVVWIQPNALSHKQYYRIVDTARQYKRPVRYFLSASAQKSAAQIADNDSVQ